MPPSPMRAFVKLLVQDPERSVRFYEALGFSRVQGDGVFTHLRWSEHADVYLVSLPRGLPLASPRGTGVLLCFTAGATVERPGLEELSHDARALGAKVEGPKDEPWFTRELLITDPDGYRLNFVEPR